MMMTRFLALIAALLAGVCTAQSARTFDVFTFTPPAGWTQDASSKGAVRLSRNANGAYCLFDLYAASRGSGNVQSDFQAEWEVLVVKPFQPAKPPAMEAGEAANGWQNRLGGASFEYQGGSSLAVLATFSAANQRASALMLGNDEACLKEFDTFLKGLRLKAPGAVSPVKPPAAQTPGVQTPAGGRLNTAPLKTAFKFDTTTFDDNWVSVAQQDWVLSRRGSVTVRLHYPNPATSAYNSDSADTIRVAWNTLVSPRYRDLQDYQQGFTLDYERPHLAAGTATSLETGQRVYVSLFEQGDSGWIEIVTPDRATFLEEYGVDVTQMYGTKSDLLKRLRNLRGLNSFAVAASDLTGSWSSDAGGMTQWVNAFTGLSAGATGFSSNVTFDFAANGTYRWSIAMASGVIGAQTFQSAKSSGKHVMKGNWQITFSDIEGKARLYNAYFEAGRDGQRILWLQDSSYGDYRAHVRVR